MWNCGCAQVDGWLWTHLNVQYPQVLSPFTVGIMWYKWSVSYLKLELFTIGVVEFGSVLVAANWNWDTVKVHGIYVIIYCDLCAWLILACTDDLYMDFMFQALVYSITAYKY